MVLQVNIDVRFLNLVSRLIEQGITEDPGEDMFQLPRNMSLDELTTAHRALPEKNFDDFIKYARERHPATYNAIESMMDGGYEWEDPLSSSFFRSIAKKALFAPVYLFRLYKDHEFKRTGDYVYACVSTGRIKSLALVCTALVTPITPVAIFLLAWAGLSHLVSYEENLSNAGDYYDFQKINEKYDYIHQKSRFFILEKIQNYFRTREKTE